MKVKTFKFEICNFAYNNENPNEYQQKRKNDIVTTEYIDAVLNSFLDNLPKGTVIDGIEKDPVTFMRHNNGRCDTVFMYCTIFYTLPEETYEKE